MTLRSRAIKPSLYSNLCQGYTTMHYIVVLKLEKIILKPFSTLSYAMLLVSLFVSLFVGCVVKEELDDTYKQAHIGMNQWSLQYNQEQKGYVLNFELGYLIGLKDQEGIQDIEWNYRLMTAKQEVLTEISDIMRAATTDRTQIFVQGSRKQETEINRPLVKNESYVLWFILSYKDTILKEQLFEIVAGEEGGDPTWIDEIPGGQSLSELVGGNTSEQSDDELGEDIAENIDVSEIPINNMNTPDAGVTVSPVE